VTAAVPAVDRVVVVVPARDEESSLPDCLAALNRDRIRCPATVEIVVVADRCRDRTARTAELLGARVLVSQAGRVGAARALGVRAALTDRDPRRTWIASTDADSVVPPGWLRHQFEAALDGVDLLLGTVALAGGRHPGWRARYAARVRTEGHDHVHGANLGIRGSTYLAAGGFPDLAAHEDTGLVDRVRNLPGARVRSSAELPVTTSDRLLGRAPAGVSHDLAGRRAPSGDAA
jgi:glycosyltransferase involved in cell wall biosynthesis